MDMCRNLLELAFDPFVNIWLVFFSKNYVQLKLVCVSKSILNHSIIQQKSISSYLRSQLSVKYVLANRFLKNSVYIHVHVHVCHSHTQYTYHKQLTFQPTKCILLQKIVT